MSLTIIIPFLNEGNEVERTVASIRETITTECSIMLINDASTDGFDYKSLAEKHGCLYFEHKVRLGVALSRNDGVDRCETQFFLLLDAHMRFYEKGWDEKLISYLEKSPRAVLCSQTRFLSKNRQGVVEDKSKSIAYAGYIDFYENKNFQVVWNNVDIEPMSNMVEVPCILGAAYATNKNYWQYLGGLKGLVKYGTDEELLSLKVWMEGGRCLLIKDWVVGHIYRKSFPYAVLSTEIIYNRLFTAELLLPYSLKRNVYRRMHLMNRKSFDQAYAMIKDNYSEIRSEKYYLKTILTRDIVEYLQWNNHIMNLNTNNTILNEG